MRKHPAQVDEHLPVDVLAARRFEDLDLTAQFDSELAVVLLRRVSMRNPRSGSAVRPMPRPRWNRESPLKRRGARAAQTRRLVFGGLAFLVGGNLAASASHRGGLMVRVDPGESDALVTKTTARVVAMRGRQMPGWLYVEARDLATKGQLSSWVERGLSFARSLPAKG